MTLDFEKHLRLTQDLTRVGSWEWDIGRDRLTWSDEHYRIFDVTPETFTPTLRGLLERVHPDDVSALESAVALCRATHESFTCEYRVMRPDSTTIPLLGRGAWDATPGDAGRMYGTAQDLTERKRAEEALLIANRRAQGLAGRVLQVQETERRRIAHELHDEIGQALTAVKIGLQRLRRKITDAAFGADIDDCATIAARALDQVRGLSLNLRPPHLDDLGLEAAIGWLIRHQCDASGVAAHFHTHGVPRRLRPELEIACFRVAQETLTNVLRHACAEDVWVQLCCRDGTLELTIEDNGTGFDVTQAHARAVGGASLGLLGMHERTLLAAGRISIARRTPAGTAVTASFPLAVQGGTAE
jgi:two-component system sensor histidine kinase UhpB